MKNFIGQTQLKGKNKWAAFEEVNYLFREKFELSQLKDHVKQGSNIAISVGDYFSTMLDQTLDWSHAEDLKRKWNGKFCLKGIMSPLDARKAVDLGADAIMISNHGGRQLDGSRSPFDQLEEIVEEVGGEIDIVLDGGIQRGTHILKDMALGATACSGGRMYLFAELINKLNSPRLLEQPPQETFLSMESILGLLKNNRPLISYYFVSNFISIMYRHVVHYFAW